jgi:hypothetical protein
MFSKRAFRSSLITLASILIPSILAASSLFELTGVFRANNVYSPIVADVNGDGYNDVLLTGNGIEVRLGNGDETFSSDNTYYTGRGIYAIAAGDFNGDHKIDLAALDSSGLEVLTGVGDGTFNAPQNLGTAGGRVIVVADINGDGKLDIVAANSSGTSESGWGTATVRSRR